MRLGALLLHSEGTNRGYLDNNNATKKEAQSVPTIEGGGDRTILSPGKSPKQPLTGIGLHDPLHGQQACPEFNSFHQGVGHISLREGLFSIVPSQNGDKVVTSPPPLIFERLRTSALGKMPKDPKKSGLRRGRLLL